MTLGVASVRERFVAVDVETANADLRSICQVGIVQFQAGEIVEEWQSLINPEDYFDAVNVSIHGISEEMAASAPALPSLYEVIERRIQSQIVVCHTGFDRLSLARACERYRLKWPEMTWLDSARVARRAWPERCGRRGYGLRDLARMLSLSFTAHVAVEDAKVAGWIVLRAIKESGLSLTDWLTRVQHPIFGDTIVQDGNPEGPLAGYVVVFTGALTVSALLFSGGVP